MGVGPERIVGVRLRDRSTSRRSDGGWRGPISVPNRSAVSVENATSPWVRDDGTSDTGIFDCVLQPVRDITGMLWICAI